MPPFGFYALCLLLWLCLLALIAWLLLRSGAKGSNKLSGAAGCLLALAFGAMALLGAVGVLLVALFDIPDQLVRHGPVRKLEFILPNDPKPLPQGQSGGAEFDTDSPERQARLRVSLDADAPWTELSQEISRWLRRSVPGDITMRTELIDAQRVLEFEFTVLDRDLANFDLALRSIQPTWRLPERSTVEFKQADESR
jgi:hypothetical protein